MTALPLDRLDAVVFDLDGVLTDTAGLHREAWKETFDAYLERRAARGSEPFRPFTDEDYRRYVDGKPRYRGARSFLESRGIELPYGSPDDPPEAETVCGLGNRKNERFRSRLQERGPERYESSVELVARLRERGVRTGVITSSRNGRDVLRTAGLEGLFDVRLDGIDAEERGLAGKPDPEMFLEAARHLGVVPGRTAVVEDAIAGVEAGRRGGFGLVVGVDRSGHGPALREAGADLVVTDLGELSVEPPAGAPTEPPVEAPAETPTEPSTEAPTGASTRPPTADGRPIRTLPSALDRWEEIARRLSGRRLAIFLDYDGTLTPIVDDPDEALLPDATRETLRRLARRFPVAVVSGRDLADVRDRVGLEGLHYAGSHGFDIEGPDLRRQRGEAYLPALDAAREELAERLADIPGARVERKRFAIAVHHRRTPAEREAEVAERVAEVAAAHPELRRSAGKKVHELRPDVEWDKGRALLWLLDALDLEDEDVLPVYIGDDVTDEDAFRALRERAGGPEPRERDREGGPEPGDRGGGLALVVRGEDDRRSTLAGYALEDPEAVRRFLEMLLERGAP